MKFVKLYIRLINKLNKLVGLSVSVLMPVMVIILFLEVTARYVFKSPTIWTYDLSIFMFGYVGLLSGAYVHQIKGHVNVDIIYSKLTLRQKSIIDSVTGLLFFFFIILVILYSSENAIYAIENSETTATEWGPPIGHFKLMIPIGASLLLLQELANWLGNIYRAITNKELKL
ncbi:TRAP transporter small permease subunit [Desulforhopalus singaporensis]|uniref:TRAP-type mannitol/chloroaromatic compound transport system, small permease component n=1 Tax=Desulforhopalus singaporensis TaxID=91360 RepID=A0A1H0SM07_9BACT|nr:TRAP transporter small permease subunit [Desulforhopalus singaporensis]SDP42589.1 TRAP-type mannitol/chloroaromatic compound transport system, small permease component [Desulforhopalus singaporensis]